MPLTAPLQFLPKCCKAVASSNGSGLIVASLLHRLEGEHFTSGCGVKWLCGLPSVSELFALRNLGNRFPLLADTLRAQDGVHLHSPIPRALHPRKCIHPSFMHRSIKAPTSFPLISLAHSVQWRIAPTNYKPSHQIREEIVKPIFLQFILKVPFGIRAAVALQFVTAVAYHFCLNASFSQAHTKKFSQLCTVEKLVSKPLLRPDL